MSVDREEARHIAESYLDRYHRIFETGKHLALVDNGLESASHWAFGWNDRRWIEAGDIRYALAGNGPIFVSKLDGAISLGGSSRTIEAQLADSPPGTPLNRQPPDRELPDMIRKLQRATADFVQRDEPRDIPER